MLYQYMNHTQRLADLIKTGGEITADIAQSSYNIMSVRYTVASLTILPIIFVYPFFQRYFTKGIMIGAVKG